MAQNPDPIVDDTPAGTPAELPFWRKPLASLTGAEWESLCDGCGRCCLVKLEDEDTGAIHFTDVSCTLLDAGSCRCSNYSYRQAHVPDCIKLTPEIVDSVAWLPPTCAYRLVADGRDLMWWHPLVSGRAETVHEAGISIRCKPTVSETEVAVEDLPEHIVSWPSRWPKKARKGQVAGGRVAGASRPSPNEPTASVSESPLAEHPGDPEPLRGEP